MAALMSNRTRASTPSRRAILQGAIIAAGAARAQDRAPTAKPVSQPIVETTAGKIRGFVMNGTYAFKGIPYGACTGGAARFQPPARPGPWAGVRSSVHYGHMCPYGNYMAEPADNAPHGDEDGYLLYRTYWSAAGEDCLRLNVWTPAIGSGRRPVLVYMHGGGFSTGSGHELVAYDSENLAHRNDVVVVTHNHRLNVLGYLNLAEYGERFAQSANAGMLDCVAALEWVRDNITNFGGDPSNVTIFGQSGGGGKVSALLAMPQAKGLFHKAVIQSWPFYRFAKPADSSAVTAAVLAELNIGKAEAARICDVPLGQLLDASQNALRKLPPSRGRRMSWQPTVDGKTIPMDPTDPRGPALSSHVPLVLGTNLNEFVSGVDNHDVDTMTVPQLRDRARERWGASGNDIIEAYAHEYPKATPFQLWAAMSAVAMRQPTITHAESKAALNAAPVYHYVFSWPTPALSGRPGTFHACEIAFIFDNVDKCPRQTGGAREALALATQMSRAWIAFARRGDPNYPGMPQWPRFDAANRATMFFDSPSAVKRNPERAGLQLIARAERSR